MRLIFISILYFVLIQTKLCAQYNWSLGLTGSSGTASYVHKVTASQSSVSSSVYGIGVSVRHMNTKHLGIQLEMNNIQKPLIVRTATYGSVHEIRRSNMIFELPILTHVELLKGPLKMILQAGPQLGILSQEKIDLPQDSLARALTIEYWESDFKPNPIQVGMVMCGGLGYIIIKKIHFGLTYRYYFGMTNTYQSLKFATFRSSFNGFFVHMHYILKN